MSAIKKNGNQQTTNAPVMMASVFAAFLSLFASIDSRVDITDVTLLPEPERKSDDVTFLLCFLALHFLVSLVCGDCLLCTFAQSLTTCVSSV